MNEQLAGKARSLSEVLKAAGETDRVAEAERGRAIFERATRPAIDADRRSADENLIRAGAINLLLARAEQNGRSYLTPTDMRRFDIVTATILREAGKEDTLDMTGVLRTAPQTFPEQEPAPGVLARMEEAMAEES